MTAYCPFNPAHIMPIESLLKHLTRCTATNKHQFGQCKYNQLHVLRKQVLDKHHLECPDNKKKNQKQYDDDDDWNIGIDGSVVQDYDNDDQSQHKQTNTGRGSTENRKPAQPVSSKYEKDRNYDGNKDKKKIQKKKQEDDWGSDQGSIEEVGTKKAPPSIPVKNQKSTKQSQSKKKQQQSESNKPFDCDTSMIEKAKTNKKAFNPTLQDF